METLRQLRKNECLRVEYDLRRSRRLYLFGDAIFPIFARGAKQAFLENPTEAGIMNRIGPKEKLVQLGRVACESPRQRVLRVATVGAMNHAVQCPISKSTINDFAADWAKA